MRNVYRIGSAMVLALFFSGSTAIAQVDTTGTDAPSSTEMDGSDADAQSAGSVPVGTTSPSTNRPPAFNRVTTTRRVAVPARSQAARAVAGGASAGVLHPYTPTHSPAREKMARNSEVPSGSSWRQQVPQRVARPPATAIRSVTHNYYPGLRGGQYVNANTARVAHGAKGRTPVGAGAGLGMGMAGARSGNVTAGRGRVSTPGRGGAPSAAAPPRR
jgi:hypothetical protein